MSERAKWGSTVTNLLMWEDKCLGDCRNLDDLEKPLDQILNELADGVVIIFQVNLISVILQVYALLF